MNGRPVAGVLLRGGGDLASGVALRLHRAGFPLLITELEKPLSVRRLVSFSEAVSRETIIVEDVTACRADSPARAVEILAQGQIPVLVDPHLQILHAQEWFFPVLVDARMTKRPPETGLSAARLVIGLGPGFVAGENCHVVIETNRGHSLGRVLWQGAPQPDTGLPEAVRNHQADRVLRAPADGILRTEVQIGKHVDAGELIAAVGAHQLRAAFDGVLRGLLPDGFPVSKGVKIGDLDPRDDPALCYLVSDKGLAIGGGVLEAILSRRRTIPELFGD